MPHAERMALLAILALGVLAPLVADGLASRLRIPAVVLEIASGIVVGPHVLDWVRPGPVIDVFAALGLLLLFFLAGFEVDYQRIRGRPIGLGLAAWFAGAALAIAIGAGLERSGMVMSGMVVALAMTTTAMGTLMPILRDGGDLDSTFGKFALAGGAVGEFAPIVMIGLVFEEGGPVRTFGLIGLFVALSVATAILASRVQPPRIVDALRRMTHTSAQLPLRASLLALGALVVLSGDLGLDTVLGAVAAGMIISLVTPDEQEEILVHKLEGVGFGFFIPIFFVVSGMRFDLTALMATPESMMRVPLFLLLFLVARGLPTILLCRRDLSGSELGALALLSATQLPVVITTIAVTAGRMQPENAAALVGAGMLSVFVFPMLAMSLRGSTR